MSDDYEKQHQAWMQQPPKQALQSFAGDVREYLKLVNKIAEVIRLTDDVSKRPIDTDITVADLMLTLLRRGEKLNGEVDKLHEYATRFDTE